jgi:hypothetical protein
LDGVNSRGATATRLLQNPALVMAWLTIPKKPTALAGFDKPVALRTP